MPTQTLNEVEKRKPDFSGGTAVLMADGQEWYLARPRVGLRRAGPGKTRMVASLPGCDFQALMDHLRDCLDFNESLSSLPEDEREARWEEHPGLHLAPAEFEIAHALLAANYDLTPEEADPLVVFAYDVQADPDGYARRRACLDVAYGHSPKPSPNGSKPA